MKGNLSDLLVIEKDIYDYGSWKTPQTGVKTYQIALNGSYGVKYKYWYKTQRRWVNATWDGKYGGRYIECALCEFPVAVLLPIVEYSCVHCTLHFAVLGRRKPRKYVSTRFPTVFPEP